MKNSFKTKTTQLIEIRRFTWVSTPAVCFRHHRLIRGDAVCQSADPGGWDDDAIDPLDDRLYHLLDIVPMCRSAFVFDR